MSDENESGKIEPGIPTNTIEFEKDFGDGLLNFVKTDDRLKSIYDRFILECENVIEVIENGKANEANMLVLKRKFNALDTKIMELKDEVKNLSEEKAGKPAEEAKKIDDKIKRLGRKKCGELRAADSDFHEQLFQIGGNAENLENLSAKMDVNLQNEIWRSIVDANHYVKLQESHSEIFESLKTRMETGEKNKEVRQRAIKAMQSHFSVILVHYNSAIQ
jgi:hypothetical protein